MPIRRGTHPRVTSLRPTLEYALVNHGTTCAQLRADGRLLGNNPAEQLSELGYVNSLKTVPGFSETTASGVQMARRLQLVDPAFEPNVVVTLQDVHCRRNRDPEKRAISLEVSRVIARSERISPTTEENLNP